MAGDFQVEGYDVDSLLTANATGELWLARARASGDVVALKRVRLPAPDGADRLRRLVTLLNMIGHPHIQPVREHILLDDGQAVLVLQHADGGNLEQLLSGRGEIDPGEAVTAIGPSAEALATAHERGVFHGDLTPSSIAFMADGRPMVSGLGLVALVGGGDEDLGMTRPEPTAADDVWTLAAIMYGALTGQQPVAGRPHPSLQHVKPDCPPGLVHAVEAGLASVPERRPAAGQLAELIYAACPPAPVRFPVALTLSDADIAEAMVKAEQLAKEQPQPGPGQQGPGQPGQPGQPGAGQPVPGQGGPPGQPGLFGPAPAPIGAPEATGPAARQDPFTQAFQHDDRPLSPPAERPGLQPYGGQFDDADDDEGPRAGRGILIALLVLVVLAAAAGGGYWWWTSRSADPATAEQSPDPRSSGDTNIGSDPTAEPTAGSTPAQTEAPSDPGKTEPQNAEERYRAVLEALDARRAQAYAIPDPGELAHVYAPGSNLLSEDQTAVQQYLDAGARVEGLRYSYQDLSVESESARRVVLVVVNQRQAFTQIDAAGTRTDHPAAEPVRQRITLQRVGGEWLIANIVDI